MRYAPKLTAPKQIQLFFFLLLLLLLLSIAALRQSTQVPFLFQPASHLEASKKLHKPLQLDPKEEDTVEKERQKKEQILANIYSHDNLDSPRMSSVQQWPHGIRYPQ